MSLRPKRDGPDRPRASLPLLLAALASMGPFCIDAYLPSFQDIGASLEATQLEVQQTLTAYMVPFALLTPWHGALSDRFGRRGVILMSLAVFSLASVGCAFSPNIETLWAFRALQGSTAGAGMVTGRAIVRDVMSGADAQRLMSRVTMAFGVAPAVAPVIGGLLQTALGWRSIFLFLALAGVSTVLWCQRSLPETLPVGSRQPLSARYLSHAYRGVLTDRAFVLGALCLASGFTGLFIYVMSAAVFLMEHLKLVETEFIWFFGPVSVGLILGSWVASRTAGRLSERATIAVGFSIMAASALANAAVSHWLEPGVPQSVAPVFCYVIGMAMTTPTLTLRLLDLFPTRRGIAASCQSLVASSMNALNSAVLAPLLWASPTRLALGQCALLATAGALAWAFFNACARRGKAAKAKPAASLL